MFSKTLFATTAAVLGLSAGIASAENPMVGGAAMYADKTIVENAVNSRTTRRWLPPSRRRAGRCAEFRGAVHRLRAH